MIQWMPQITQVARRIVSTIMRETDRIPYRAISCSEVFTPSAAIAVTKKVLEVMFASLLIS